MKLAMYKSWVSHMHMPDMHKWGHNIITFIHDERFIMTLIAILCVAVMTMIIWLSANVETGEFTNVPYYPFH